LRLENSTQNGNTKKNVFFAALFLYNLALITHDATKSVNPSIAHIFLWGFHRTFFQTYLAKNKLVTFFTVKFLTIFFVAILAYVASVSVGFGSKERDFWCFAETLATQAMAMFLRN